MVVAFPGGRGSKGLLFMGLAAYLLFMMFVNRGPIRWVHALWVLCFYILSILSRKWSAYPGGAEVVISNLSYAIMLNWSLAEYVFQGKRSLKHMCSLLAILSLLLSFNFIANGTVNEQGRFSLGINANVMGMNAAYLFGIMLYGAKESQWKKWYWTMLAVMLAVIALLTGSRKALVMLLIFSFAYIFMWKREKNFVKFFGRILGVAAVCTALIFLLMKVEVLYNSIGNRLESLYLQWVSGGDADASAITRERMVEIGIELFRKDPLLGFGHNAFKLYSGYFTYSHNNYIELMCSLGVIGLAIYYIPLIYFTIEAFRLWIRGVQGSILPLVILIIEFINDIGQVSYYSFQVNIFLGMAIGYVYLLRRQYRLDPLSVTAPPKPKASRFKKKQEQAD